MSQKNQRQFEVREEKGRSVGGVTKSPFSPPESSEKAPVEDAKDSLGSASGEQPKKKKKIGPSGSKWALSHINWLHVLLEVGCDWEDLFSSESELIQSSKIAVFLKKELGKDWKYICDTYHENSNLIYARLQDLVAQMEPDDDFNTATQSSTGPLTPSSVKPESLGGSTTPRPYRYVTQDPQRT